MTPLYIIEEHHEAFYIWNRAVCDGFLPPFGNTLLHVDHHLDFEFGVYNGNLDALFASLEDMHNFTYKALGIADFICPAIYQGVFNDIVNVINFVPFISKPTEKIIIRIGERTLNVKDSDSFSRRELLKPDSDCRLFTYSQGGPGEFHTPQTIALDIDLDYFCWDESLSSVLDKRLEITKEAYYEASQNPYHPFRLLPKAWLSLKEENGRYYLCYLDSLAPDPLAKKELIEKRISIFIDWLKIKKIEASVISICRSRYSGYTPSSVWEEIENNLLKGLSEVYEYDLQS